MGGGPGRLGQGQLWAGSARRDSPATGPTCERHAAPSISGGIRAAPLSTMYPGLTDVITSENIDDFKCAASCLVLSIKRERAVNEEARQDRPAHRGRSAAAVCAAQAARW